MAYKLMYKLGLDYNELPLYDLKKEKPKQNMEIEFEKLISLLDHSNDVLNIRVARYLLLLDSYTRQNIAEFLRTRTRKLIQNRYKKIFYNPYAAYNYEKECKIEEIPVIMIFLLESSSKLFKDIVARKRFLMERVINPKEDNLCILVGINKEGHFKKAQTVLIKEEYFKQLDKRSYDLLMQAREAVTKSRTFIES